ncbi:MAG: spore germination protein [Lachnospiraceae bacterium]|nr:spore germination protein [Lachnospiraceae bacterium]
MREIGKQQNLYADLQANMDHMDQVLGLAQNFDIIHRTMAIGDRQACMYLINGFGKDELLQKLLQFFISLPPEKVPQDADGFIEHCIPHVEANPETDVQKVLTALLSGMFVLLVEGYEKAVIIDARNYPARSVEEPEKDKALRGSKDGFVETVAFNTALIRRRIRSEKLRMEIQKVGECSQTDVVLCYMTDRVDEKLLQDIRQKVAGIQTESLTMNQESLAECIYKRKWFNPFPKFKYTERPDTAAAQILEGNIVILVDNSPSAMILPITLFDILDEADDYYFPPITGTYLRLARFVIAIMTYIVTPTYLLLMQRMELVPGGFEFIELKEAPNIPLIWQFLILELAIDGLKLAAVNTPSMLSTPLSVMAALVLGEFSVKSGWFSSEVMLYMAFVAIANYTQANYELGYALKFMRVIALIATAVFGVYGYTGAIGFAVLTLLCNQTVAGRSYLYPLIPFDWKKLKSRLFRKRHFPAS